MHVVMTSVSIASRLACSAPQLDCCNPLRCKILKYSGCLTICANPLPRLQSPPYQHNRALVIKKFAPTLTKIIECSGMQ